MDKITRRDFNKKLMMGIAGFSAVSSNIIFSAQSGFFAPSKDKRPNFVFISSDQHNAKYLGFMGHPFVKTPNLDKIAERGIVFSNTYCGNPVCAPARSSMMTGMYASDVNSFCNSTVYDGSYPTWAKRLKDSGYYCWATGKQDLNPEVDMGFVEVDVDHGHSKKPDITSLLRRPCIYRVGERETVDGKSRTSPSNDKVDADHALNFLKNESGKLNKPWVCYVGFHMPHPKFVGWKKYYDYYLDKVEVPEVSIEELENLPLPYQELRNFKRISTPIPSDRIKRAIASYFAMITELDDYIGQIYNALEETGQLDNTYFIYTSDHGEALGEHGLWLKDNLYDVAARVPLVISGPGLKNSKRIQNPVGHIDLAATILELSGIKKINELRGTSLLPLVNGDESKGPEFAYSESHPGGNPTGSCMIRKGDWKLIHFSYYEDMLFDMKNDPDEKNNLINDPKFKEKAVEMRNLLYSKVNPEEITDRAFKRQDNMLNEFTEKMNEEELTELFKSRLGEGQARVIARKLKKEYLVKN